MLGPFGKYFFYNVPGKDFSDKAWGKWGAAWGGVKALFILMYFYLTTAEGCSNLKKR